MAFIKKHKTLVIVLSIILILIIGVLFLVKMLMVDEDGNEYGNRLQGIESVTIKNETISKLKSEIKALEEVDNINYRLQGRLIYITLTLNDGISIDNAKEIGTKILEYFSQEEKNYYDIQMILKNKNKEMEGYPKIGYKHKSTETVVW